MNCDSDPLKKCFLKNISSYLRKIFWPIYGKENLKFIPMLLMMSLALFVYAILRINKDVFILSVASSNSISFLKAYFVLPCSFLYMIIFYFLCNRLSPEKVFFFTILPFFIFYILFYLIFLPYNNYFHLSQETLDFLIKTYPRFKNFFPIICYWSYSLYYIFSELWSSVVITFLFWNFANCIVTPIQTQKFYAFFASYSYAGLILGSFIERKIYLLLEKCTKNSKEYDSILFINFYLIIAGISMFLFLYWLINNHVLPYENHNLSQNMKLKPKKTSFMANFKTIVSSKYLIYLSILLLCYGCTTNLIEITWKEVVKKELITQEKMGLYLSDFYFCTGLITIILGLLNKHITGKFGWKNSLLLTPIMIFISSIIFFMLIIYPSIFSSQIFGFSSLYLALQVGFAQDIMIKSCKYAMFDPNIQSSYVPLNDDLKIKGKAAVDIIGARTGKAGASVLESTFSILFKGADQIELAPIFMPIVLLVCGIWMFYTILLSNEYEKLLKYTESNNENQCSS